jgi:hypothetical protein
VPVPWTGCSAPCDEATGLCTYTARVDLHASEFGYYNFDECTGESGGNMPDIGMELGRTYRFVQSDVSNYFHPLGFAYEPDGALSGAEELDEAMYLKYQLKGEVITLEGGYEPQFGHPIEQWATNGDYYGEFHPPSFSESTARRASPCVSSGGIHSNAIFFTSPLSPVCS